MLEKPTGYRYAKVMRKLKRFSVSLMDRWKEGRFQSIQRDQKPAVRGFVQSSRF